MDTLLKAIYSNGLTMVTLDGLIVPCGAESGWSHQHHTGGRRAEGGVGGLAVFAASVLAEDLEFCKGWLSDV